MLLDFKTACCVGLTVASLALAQGEAAAQLVPHRAMPHRASGPHPAGPCRSATCGSPLAGPCAPARMTYNYVPVNWRRWPTHTADLPPAPEELPTPTKLPEAKPSVDELPEQQEPSSTPMPSQQESQSPLSQPQSPAPFGAQPSAPNFGEEPQMTPFGDEPQPPPSAADPLAVPLGDEPPAPPADEAPTLQQDQVPAEAAPFPQSSAPMEPADSGQPPQMPADDPFQDDPESSSFGPPAMGNRMEQAYLQRRQQLQPAASDGRLTTAVEAEIPAGPPRLLHADGGSLEARVLPEPAAAPPDANPLRQVSHPVRKTSGVQAAAPSSKQWRKNPLRAN